jgi:hypothetical protein
MEQGIDMVDELSQENLKLVTEQQTAADALWGYRDIHGAVTPGLVQRVGTIETKQNWSLGILALSFGKAVGPDVINAVLPYLKTAILWFR